MLEAALPRQPRIGLAAKHVVPLVHHGQANRAERESAGVLRLCAACSRTTVGGSMRRKVASTWKSESAEAVPSSSSSMYLMMTERK